MIKNYLELDKYEIKKVLDFTDRKEKVNNEDELDRMFKIKIYNYGEGVLFCFKDNIVVGKVCVVFKEIKITGTSYIHNIKVLESELKKELVLYDLINKAREKAINSGAKEILIGVRDERVLEVLKELGFEKDYDSIIMELKNRTNSGKILELVSLSYENKVEYLNVYNDSFNNMPHGTSLDNEELEEYLKKSNSKNCFFMVHKNGENIGFFNCEIENGEGSFDIGLCKKYRGYGYGRLLLETAIDFLNNKEVEKISLIVIERNRVAYELYKKRGFEKKSVLSHWIADKK